mgnify:CR=1 FL=1
MPLITLDVPQAAVDKAKSICATLGVHNLSQLFDQMVEELEWNLYYAPPVRAALLARRAAGKVAATQPGDAGQQGSSDLIK